LQAGEVAAIMKATLAPYYADVARRCYIAGCRYAITMADWLMMPLLLQEDDAEGDEGALRGYAARRCYCCVDARYIIAKAASARP